MIARLVGRLMAGAEAFAVGRAVGKHVDANGLELTDDLAEQLQGVLGKHGRWAFAAGVATLGWAFLTRKELILVFLAGLLVGYGAFEKILERLRGPALAPTFEPNGRVAVDTTASVN